MSKDIIHRVAKIVNKKIFEKHLINAKNSHLEHVSFKVIQMKENQTLKLKSQENELCLVIQSGTLEINSKKNNKKYQISRSENLFDKIPSDSLYVGPKDFIVMKSITACEFLIATAKAREDLPTTFLKVQDVKIEERGIIGNKRTVFNILDDKSKIASNLLVVEVFTDGANWSSYPPHKHDTFSEDQETILEETYFHKIYPENGFVLQRIYDKSEKPFDEAFVVKNDDVVIVKRGYHPVAVPPGYQSYYLNIMAGPIRKWNFTNDPDYQTINKKK